MVNNDKKFWKTVKPVFSNSDPMSNEIILVGNGDPTGGDPGS